MDKEKLNRLRRMAGAPVDYSPEPRKVTSLIEDGIPGISQIFRGGDHKFYLVADADEKSDLGDVLTEVDFPALVNILRSAKDTKGWELFPHNEKNKALDLARKRLATAGITEEMGMGAWARNADNTPHPTAEEMAKAEEEELDPLDYEEDWEPSTNICPECEGGEHPPVSGVCERCGGLGEIYESEHKCACGCKPADCKCGPECECGCNAKEEQEEVKPDFADIDKDGDKKEPAKKAAKEKKVKESMHYHTDGKYKDFEDDESEAINAVGSETVHQHIDDVADSQAEEDYEMANDTDSIKVPSKILRELKRVIDETTAEAEKAKPRSFERAHYYEATAEALQIVHDLLSEKTVEGLKRAQIYVHRMANVSRALIPDVVWKFIIDGGVKRSLKSYVNDVKDPVTGKPFGVVDVKTLNKNTHTE